ncbi:MAG: SEC-C domain-containing protein, partial [Clostridia bacterium]|nr:SEC-C domain-containing protein [Clostridia bacterium]
GQRNQVLDGVDMDATIRKMVNDSISDTVPLYCAHGVPAEQWNMVGLRSKYVWLIGDGDVPTDKGADGVTDYLIELALSKLDEMTETHGKDIITKLEHMVLIRNVDINWMDHIDAMDQLKRGIGLRAYAQQDPVIAFRQESDNMLDEMNAAIKDGTVQMLFTTIIRSEEDLKRSQTVQVTSTSGGGDDSVKKEPVKKGAKIGRNDPCPCGSGKKYKHCCGR